jgi:RNA polymerase sigma factor (TIGR02999 family)
MVYEELKRLARRLFQSEAPGHTLQPTALVNEAFSSLVRSNVSLNDRAHFYALCARMMRRILVNHALKRKAVKRGSGATHVSLDDAPVGREDKGVEVLALDEALADLADADERKARLLELHYFGGLTYDELASTMSLSSSQIHRDLRAAKAWLKVRLAA